MAGRIARLRDDMADVSLATNAKKTPEQFQVIVLVEQIAKIPRCLAHVLISASIVSGAIAALVMRASNEHQSQRFKPTEYREGAHTARMSNLPVLILN